jgi:hypothetical protein
VFNPVQIEVEATVVPMRSLGSYKNKVFLSQHEFDLVDASVFNKFFEVAFEIRDSIADARFVADAAISGKVLWNFTVIPGDMNGFVVFPNNRLVLVCVL